LPLGPQVLAKPVHEGRAWQAFVDVLQTGVAPLQSAFERQLTHADVVLCVLHFGALPGQAAQVAPQLASVLHSAHTAWPLQAWLLGQGVSLDR
jgi:hypothetical protein